MKRAAKKSSVTPSLLIQEVESTPLPTIPNKKKTKSVKKPPVVATITPDGIEGELAPAVDRRPLIAHLPVRTVELDSNYFADTDSVVANAESGIPVPFEAETDFTSLDSVSNMFMGFSDKSGLTASISSAAAAAPAAPAAAAAAAATQSVRPSLPLHYSEKLMVRFQDANREQTLPENTDVACFWDCHPFRGVPCVIPAGIEEDVWRVYGNFCCPECAAAYLFAERLDSHVQWERFALLNRLYAPGNSNTIRLAPARTVLRMFGGPMDIVDYRTSLADGRMRIDVMMPPMISIIQVMDTKPIDFYDASIKNNFIPWEMDRLNRPGAQGLRLRRSKPISEKENTLEYCMRMVKT